MENNLPSEFAILCKDEKEAQICIDWAKRNNVVMWSDLPFTTDRCYFLKTKHNDYFFSTVKDGLSLILPTSLTEEQGDKSNINFYVCIKAYPSVELGHKEKVYPKTNHEWYKKYSEYWKPIYRVKTQREIDHELIDKISINVYGVSNTEFSDYLKENNYAIVKREYEN